MPSRNGAHILVVDHAPEIMDLMRELLEEAGYQVTTLHRAGQNLDKVVDASPDLIIIDYMWPSSDNEWTLLNLLTMDRRTRDIPVIVCTAAIRHVEEAHEHLERIGVVAVYKPFDIDHLLRVVAELLERNATGRESTPGSLELE